MPRSVRSGCPVFLPAISSAREYRNRPCQRRKFSPAGSDAVSFRCRGTGRAYAVPQNFFALPAILMEMPAQIDYNEGQHDALRALIHSSRRAPAVFSLLRQRFSHRLQQSFSSTPRGSARRSGKEERRNCRLRNWQGRFLVCKHRFWYGLLHRVSRRTQCRGTVCPQISGFPERMKKDDLSRQNH